jgi:hypothetical protein
MVPFTPTNLVTGETHISGNLCFFSEVGSSSTSIALPRHPNSLHELA